MNTRKILALILLTGIISCKKHNIDNVPSYITIESITLEENTTHNITDAWVYIDDNLQGIYELPANFPVLASGKHKLRIKAGIKDNGIAASRVQYPFYSSYIEEERLFNPDTTFAISPIISYLESTSGHDNPENFEGLGLDLEIDSITFSIDNTNSLDGKYGVLHLSDSIVSTTEITTKELYNLPQEGAPVYLELDYRCNTEFSVGVYIHFPQSAVLQKTLIGLYPKEEWNKTYVNLTSTISEAVGADFFKIFISMQRDTTIDTNTINFDNFKVVY